MRYLTGVLSIVPILGMIVAMVYIGDHDSNVFTYCVYIINPVTLVLIIGYIAYIFKNNAVPKEKRALWTVVILFAHALAFPFFWYFYVYQTSNEST